MMRTKISWRYWRWWFVDDVVMLFRVSNLQIASLHWLGELILTWYFRYVRSGLCFCLDLSVLLFSLWFISKMGNRKFFFEFACIWAWMIDYILSHEFGQKKNWRNETEMTQRKNLNFMFEFDQVLVCFLHWHSDSMLTALDDWIKRCRLNTKMKKEITRKRADTLTTWCEFLGRLLGLLDPRTRNGNGKTRKMEIIDLSMSGKIAEF